MFSGFLIFCPIDHEIEFRFLCCLSEAAGLWSCAPGYTGPLHSARFILLRLLCCAIWHGGLAQKQCVAELTEEPENRLKQAPIFEVPSDTSMLEFWHPELAGPLQPVRDAATRVCCTRLPRGLRRTLAHYHNF